MGLITIKRKLINELPMPLHAEVTPQLLQGLVREGINTRCRWNVKEHCYDDVVEADYKKYYVDAEICETNQGGLEKVLVVDFYNLDLYKLLNRPQHRLMMAAREFVTYETKYSCGKVEHKFRESMVDKLEVSMSYYYDGKCDSSRILIDPESGKKINMFLHSYKSDPFGAIYERQQDIRESELKERHRQLGEKIDMEMQVMPSPLSDATIRKWAEEHVFRENRYIVYKRKGKKINGECSHCHAQVLFKKARHDTKGVCPNCKSEVVLKSHGRAAPKESFCKKLAVFQRCDGGFVVRHYFLSKRFSSTYMQNELYVNEKVRTIYRGGNNRQYYYDYFQGTNEQRWCKTYRASSEFSDVDAYVFTPNLRRVLKDTRYRYCALYEYAKTNRAVNVNAYLDKYEQHPQIEYLVKLGLYRLTREIVKYGYSANDLQGNNIIKVLQVPKSHVPLLRELDATYGELKIIRAACEAGKVITYDDISLLRMHEKNGMRHDTETIKHIAANVRLSSALEYCYKIATKKYQSAKSERGMTCCSYGYASRIGTPGSWMRDAVGDFKDYLDECRQLELDLSDKQIAFPKNFYAAHARTSAMCEAKASELEQIAIKRIAEEFKKYNFTFNELRIRVAETAEEIIAEGKEQHHCVGGYVKDVAARRSVIFFLRRKEEPDTAYYTVEIDPDSYVVEQYRGYRNNNANNPVPQEVHEFIAKWKKHITKQKKTKSGVEIKVPVAV